MKKIFKVVPIMMLLMLGAWSLPAKAEKVAVTKDVEFKVMHVNDTHGRVEEGKYDGMGLARISTMVKEERAKDKNVLFLDAGDTFHGTVFASLSKGASIVRIMNKMGYDAMTTGNHDYNYGLDRLENLQKDMNFPILVSNVTSKETGEKIFKPYIIKTLPNGVKVGIFGLATPETAYKTNPTNVEAVLFNNPVEAAKESVKALEAQGVNYIIALAHLGVDEDSLFTSIRIANEVEGIDLIVDGHSHTTLEKGMKVKKTLIVQSGFYDKNLGEVTIKLNKDGSREATAKLFSKDYAIKNVKEDPTIKAMVEKENKTNEKVTSVVVGKSDVLLNGERDSVRAGETNLGDMITETMLKETKADGVITNGGGIRTSIKPGVVTRGDIIAVLPFGNYTIVKEVKGKDIKAALENGVQSYPDLRGGFPHVAGFRFKFDPAKKIGEKVYDITFNNGQKIDMNKTYDIAVNDFMAAGGDEYTMFKDKKTVNEYESLEEMLGAYIGKYGITNKTTDGRVFAGAQKEKATPTTTKSTSNTYTVKKGDTLAKVAKKVNINIDDILKENKEITNPDIIFVGEKISLPKAN